MRIRRFLLWSLLSLLSGIGAAEQCSPHDTENVLQINNAYTYHFRSVALSQAVGTTEDQGKMVLNCDVRISHDQACLYNMELQNCAVTASGGEPGSEVPWIDQQPLPDLSKYHVAFSLVNGEIKEVRTHEDDPLYYVNIKRGVLSAFVFKMSQTREERKENHTDIHGTCPLTSVPVTDSDGTVKTSKDMLYCNFPSRRDWQFSPWSLFWNMSFIQHLINSTTDCDYQVSTAEKRLEKVYCKERHAIMLESTHRTTTAVQTNVHYYMDFVKSEVQTSKPRFPALTRKTDIRFEYEDTPVPVSSPPNFLPVAKKMLSDLVLDSVEEIRLFTIPQFTDFVAWIRTADDLTSLVESVRFCAYLTDGRQCTGKLKERALSFLSDALVQCNTVPCTKGITEMAKNHDLSLTYLEFVYRSWSYMHYSKQGFLTNFMDICRTSNSHQCWISLGTFVRRISSRENMLEEKVFEEMKIVAQYFRTAILEDCEIQDDTEKKQYSNCLAFLKATGNIGTYLPRLLTNGMQHILDQATNDEAPVFVRTSALEAIKEISDPSDKQQSHLIYDQLLPLLKDASLAPSVRLLSYDQLLLVSEEHYFEEHLLGILKDEKNDEVKFYIANSLNELFKNEQFKQKREKFLNSLNELLLENGLSLEVIIYETKGKSKSFSQGLFLNMPFMPDFMRKSGLRVTDSAMYDAYIYPAVFNHKTMLQLFSTLLPVTKLGSYFEGWEELVLAYQKNLAQMDSTSTSYSNVYEAVMKALEEYGQNDYEGSLKSSFGENIISNIKALHDTYWLHHKKLDPYAKAYFDLFGSTMKHFVQDNMQSSSMHKELTKLTRYLLNGLEDGMTYNTTRVIRIIEAYHQVPTMMGLPLNWTTNATLAFSMRAGIKLKYDDGSQIYKGFLQPSAALTFLNRMVLDFPTLTQIGVQANSSGYTSTELKAQYTSSKGKHQLRIERPSRTQKVLELFRTNQMIKHNNYIDIPDWDIERTSSSWCTSGNTNSVAGLKACLTKSYPKVTDRMKPWALMAGSCKWQFLLDPVDEKSLYYDVELQETPKQKSTEFSTKFSVIGKEKEKTAHFRLMLDNKGKSVELKTNLLPDFSASLTRNDITKNKKVLGYKIEGRLKIFKDFKYEVEYSNEGKIEKTQGKDHDPNDENSKKLTNEEKFSLVTPSAGYKWKKAVIKNGENSKIEVSLLYENLNSKSNWIRMILPPTFWEDDKKASMKILMNWKKPIHLSEGTVTRQTEFRITVPHFIVTVDGDSLDSEDREWMHVNLAKTNVKEKKLETFLNFTYDYWGNRNSHGEQKVVRVVNVTIPWRSWAGTFQMIRNDMKYLHEMKLKRIHMTPKSEEKVDYVGWWSDEVGNQFRLEEQEVKIVADNEILFMTEGDLLRKYESLSMEDTNGNGGTVLVSNVVLSYPLYGRVETLEFDGYFILSKGPLLFRFQKDFDLTSSYNNLVLTSHTVYKNDRNYDILDHRSYFTHTGSQTKAYNTIYFSRTEPEGECKRLVFKHNIKSHVLDLSTDATYECSKIDEKLYTLLLKLNTNSSKWNMLDLNLDQIVKDVSPEYRLEDMTANHPTGTMHVDAEWHGKSGSTDHWKRAVLCSKSGNCPNAELFLEFFNDGRTNVKLSLPNQNASVITYERRMSRDSKKLHILMGFSSKENSLSKFIDFTGEIIDRNYHVWNLALKAKTFAKVKELVLSGYESAMSTVTDVANDKYHPLNEILKPALKMTIHEYWMSMKAQAEEYASISWSEIKEIFYSFESLTEPAYIIVVNSITGVSDFLRMTYNAVKDKSVLIWAINYFEIPHYFKQSIGIFPRSLSDLMHQLVHGQEETLHFKYVTGKIISMESFRWGPSISYVPELLPMVYRKIQEMTSRQSKATTQKVAMIFGPRHVYTFDGHLFEVPKYPQEDCAFLLAHDIHKSLFTVFSSEKGIHILFPEMSIAIDDRNDVFINGSQKATALPMQASNGKVTIKRGQVVEVWSPSLRVICSSRDFLCVLMLKEFHTGGVIGLLGNADGSLDNEYMLPNGNISPSRLEYITSYEVSGKPQCKNLVLETATAPSDEELSTCERYFEDVCYHSPYTRQMFLKACVSNIRVGHSACYAAAGLSALCHFKYPQPSHTTCNIKVPVTQRIGRNLEIVLVVQESKHFTSPEQSNAPLKGIESLVRAIDSRFTEDGYDNIKYSLVGYGGHGIHYAPSVHSTDRNTWLSSEELTDALKTLEFRSREEADGTLALKYALEELGYDSFSSKVAIVLTVKDRQISDSDVTTFIRDHLDVNGITLYTFSNYPSIEKGKKVFGVRADGLLFPSQTKDGDAYLDYPRGSLAKLTSSTRGSLFLSKFLVESKPSSFFTEVAQEVWAKVNKESEKCRSCTPVRGRLWWYNQECSIMQC